MRRIVSIIYTLDQGLTIKACNSTTPYSHVSCLSSINASVDPLKEVTYSNHIEPAWQPRNKSTFSHTNEKGRERSLSTANPSLAERLRRMRKQGRNRSRDVLVCWMVEEQQIDIDLTPSTLVCN